MSGWKIVTRWLDEAGPGAHSVAAFDQYTMPESSVRSAIASAIEHGVMVNTAATSGIARTHGGQFVLTDLGRDWLDGRVSISYVQGIYRPGAKGRTPGTGMRAAATWLKALPPQNAIRLGTQ